MTVLHARNLLNRPIFGNVEHIKAAELLGLFEELCRLRISLHMRPVPCPCCQAEGYKDCPECGHEIDCHACHGHGGFETLDRASSHCQTLDYSITGLLEQISKLKAEVRP